MSPVNWKRPFVWVPKPDVPDRSQSRAGLSRIHWSFVATALPDVADSIIVVSGDNQGGQASTPLPNPIVFRLVDQFENPLSGSTLNFNVVPGGGSGSVVPISGVTDTNGESQQSGLWERISSSRCSRSSSHQQLAVILLMQRFNRAARTGLFWFHSGSSHSIPWLLSPARRQQLFWRYKTIRACQYRE